MIVLGRVERNYTTSISNFTASFASFLGVQHGFIHSIVFVVVHSPVKKHQVEAVMHINQPLAIESLNTHLNTRCKPDPYCSQIVKLSERDKKSVLLVSACILTTHTHTQVCLWPFFHTFTFDPAQTKGTQAYLQGKHFSKTSLCIAAWPSGMYWQKSCREAEPSKWSIVSACLSASVNNLQCCFPLLMQSALTFTCAARVSYTDPSKLLLFQLCWTY